MEVKKKIRVQIEQSWPTQRLKRLQRYSYIFGVAFVVVCYELKPQQRATSEQAVCCVDHNFSFNESQLRGTTTSTGTANYYDVQVQVPAVPDIYVPPNLACV